ncbi:MAG: Jag N-terminal domain-containing protein [Elusimicrobiaceae bacterium]|nr:Jag N-terminal domain-containing protein [Elusimicrobiaceae bacterium]
MSKEYKFEGKNVQVAIESGLAQLGLRRDQVEVAVIAEGTSGFLGLGAKPAIIKITERIWKTAEAPQQITDSKRRRNRGGRAAEDPKPAAAAGSSSAQKAQKQPQIKRRSAQVKTVQVPLKGRKDAADKIEKSCAEPAAPLAEKPLEPAIFEDEMPKQEQQAGFDFPEQPAAQPAGQEPPAGLTPQQHTQTAGIADVPSEPDETAVQPAQRKTEPEPDTAAAALPPELEPAAKLAQETVSELLDRMGVAASGFATGWDPILQRILLSFDCDSPAMLIGRDGQTLQSLQYLVTLIVNRRTGGTANIALDTGEYRKQQEDRIAEEVKRGVNIVRARGEMYRLPSMDAAHRRFVHKMLENSPDVETFSEGEHKWRKVVLRPRKS